VALSHVTDLASSVDAFIETDGKRQQPTLSRKDKENIAFNIASVKLQTTNTLQCVVKGL
jgi:hypothetical protein